MNNLNWEVVYQRHEDPEAYVYAAFAGEADANTFWLYLINKAFDYDKVNVFVRKRVS